jgi:hypothetical protein
MKKIILATALLCLAFLTGCATPLGQAYGTVGGLGGAAIGAAAGGGRGAIIGGVAGALAGGLVGDQQTYQNGGPQYQGQPPVYVAPRPRCWIQHGVPVRDYQGYIVGYRDQRVCQ